ncbi:flavin reductase family protein [Streptomyces ficellus]|uniref:Flavin reductase family protein n=1 Tax=Streptomyces ficellus TaxID=1977088 RepID=A0ABT7Z8Z5_9ACTN|nr:flavin reductase family protein [Streptomyces ficellus]MDN3295972.1 flavin reductase family protein [Streptomyces ficellus]
MTDTTGTAEADAFRATMAHMPTCVTVVTASARHGPVGCTASAVLSLSLHPPGLLVSLAAAGRTAREIRRVGAFAVNLLSWEQRDLTRRFAEEPPCRRFTGVPWAIQDGQPVLAGVAASVVCAVDSCYDVWDHTLLVGRVVHSVHHPDRTPLLYHRRAHDRPAAQGVPPGGLSYPSRLTGRSA